MRKRFFDPDFVRLPAEKFYFCSPTLRFGVSTRRSEYHEVFSIVFKCEFLIFGENFHLFFLSKILIFNTFP